MNSQNNISKIMLKYYRGIVDENELEMYKSKLRDIDIDLKVYDKSNKIMACIEDFTNQVNLLIGSPIVQTITMGLMTNTSYDILKSMIIWMWNSLTGKKLTMLRAGGECKEKEVTFGFRASIDEVTSLDFRLYGDISNEDKSKCIDKAFEFLKEPYKKISPNVTDFARYDHEKEEWILVNVIEEIQKVVEKEKMNNL